MLSIAGTLSAEVSEVGCWTRPAGRQSRPREQEHLRASAGQSRQGWEYNSWSDVWPE